MDERTATMKAASEVVDETIVRNFAKLQDLLGNTDIFMLDDLQMKISNNVGTVTVPMLTQHMMEDVFEELQNYVNVNILFAFRTADGSHHKLVTYSMPYQDEMYIISMESEQYGIVEQMSVTLFESLDIMLAWLRSCLLEVEGKERELEIDELQELADLYRIFF